jgi:hypothetical protein
MRELSFVKMPCIGHRPCHQGVSVLNQRKKEELILFSIKALAMATAVAAGVGFAMPVTSQATPVTSPVQIQTGSDSNIVNVNNKTKSKDWWARHCAISNDVKCRRHYTKHRLYKEPYYGQYRPHHKPGVTLKIY